MQVLRATDCSVTSVQKERAMVPRPVIISRDVEAGQAITIASPYARLGIQTLTSHSPANQTLSAWFGKRSHLTHTRANVSRSSFIFKVSKEGGGSGKRRLVASRRPKLWTGSRDLQVLGPAFLRPPSRHVTRNIQGMSLALSSANLKPISWDGRREGERFGVASQPIKVSFRANENSMENELKGLLIALPPHSVRVIDANRKLRHILYNLYSLGHLARSRLSGFLTILSRSHSTSPPPLPLRYCKKGRGGLINISCLSSVGAEMILWTGEDIFYGRYCTKRFRAACGEVLLLLLLLLVGIEEENLVDLGGDNFLCLGRTGNAVATLISRRTYLELFVLTHPLPSGSFPSFAALRLFSVCCDVIGHAIRNGVVVLSCTDSSASSTSGTSDITDPGSPFSTTSTHSSASEGSDDSSGASPCKVWPPHSWDAMAPNVPSRDAGPNWGWYGKERDAPPLVALSTPLSTVAANVIANLPTDPLKRPATDQKTAATRKGIGSPSAKRQRVDRKVSRVQGKVTPCIPLCDQQKNKCCCDDPVANAAPDIILQQQEKITHYFKAQGQLFNGANNDGAVANTAPEFSLISGNKPVSSPKSVDGKSDIVTPPSVAVSSWDSCDVDSRTSNVSQVVVEKNNNTTTTAKSPAHCRKSTAQKVLFVKRNCVKVLPSQSLSAQKLDDFLGSSALPKLGSLFPPPSATQNGSTGKLATPECLSKPNKPSSSATSKVASISNNNNNISCSLPKPLVPDVEVLLVKLDQDSSKPPLKPKTLSEKESSSLSCSLPEPASSSETSSCLSVNVSPAACLPPPPLGSPILSIPRTIRFPAAQRGDAASGHRLRDGSLPEQLDGIVCKWDSCNNCFDTSTGLLDHLQPDSVHFYQFRLHLKLLPTPPPQPCLQAKHVNPQVPGEHYVCLWVGCKVYDHMSCSRSWLERHVLSHGGKEVHSCIIKGCGRRFSSQVIQLLVCLFVTTLVTQSEVEKTKAEPKRGAFWQDGEVLTLISFFLPEAHHRSLVILRTEEKQSTDCLGALKYTKHVPCLAHQVALQRHVNNHLNQSEGSNAGNAAKRGVDNTNNKPIRRNGKKFRLRRQPYSVGIPEGAKNI
uniref:C2H2-type domain-containing protein n=1 Tax=Timema tahoe TaxID=61484 RepID=A0A7R9IIC4_9NEOP|nr:unnamed protein product [Timema tahoe]